MKLRFIARWRGAVLYDPHKKAERSAFFLLQKSTKIDEQFCFSFVPFRRNKSFSLCYNATVERGDRVHTVVYGDVLFLLNFSIDFLVLLLAGCFLHFPRKLFRLLPAAFLGGVYAVFRSE